MPELRVAGGAEVASGRGPAGMPQPGTVAFFVGLYVVIAILYLAGLHIGFRGAVHA